MSGQRTDDTMQNCDQPWIIGSFEGTSTGSIKLGSWHLRRDMRHIIGIILQLRMASSVCL